MSYKALVNALGIDDGSPKVYKVVSISNGKARLELNGSALNINYNGGYVIGDSVIVRGGNVESVAQKPQTYYID